MEHEVVEQGKESAMKILRKLFVINWIMIVGHNDIETNPFILYYVVQFINHFHLYC